MNGTAPHFVGAMKIARNVAVFGWWVEWYSPGSLSEGAGSPQGLTEGVFPDEWWNVPASEPS